MDDSIFPTFKRLQTALTTASTVTKQISQIFRQAEEEAARRALLHGSKAATRLGIKDLDDANDAYEHFLDGNGADRCFNLDEYIAEDPSSKMALDNMTRDAMLTAENIGSGRDSFQMTSNRAYAVGVGDPNHPDYGRFPYPETENWQKAIDAHNAWTSSNVQVTINPDGTRHYRMEMTVHADDRYNFNPGANDITTGIPDSANGRGWRINI